MDLSEIHGSCANIGKMFEGGGVGSAGVGERESPLKRRTSCADMRSMWEDHMNKSILAPPDQIAERNHDSLMGKRTL